MKLKTTDAASRCTEQQHVRLFADWFADKVVEYRMTGLGRKEAKEKAMEDWYLYEEPNASLSLPRDERG
jgi:hypothetical protein